MKICRRKLCRSRTAIYTLFSPFYFSYVCCCQSRWLSRVSYSAVKCHVTAALLHRLDAELVVVWESSRLEGFLFVFRFVLFFAGGGGVVVVVVFCPPSPDTTDHHNAKVVVKDAVNKRVSS